MILQVCEVYQIFKSNQFSEVVNRKFNIFDKKKKVELKEEELNEIIDLAARANSAYQNLDLTYLDSQFFDQVINTG